MLADHLTGADPDAAYHGSRNATKLKVAGVDVASMGIKRPEREDDEFVRFSEPQARGLQVRGRARRQAGRRDPARRHRQGRVPDPELRPRAAAARGAGGAAVRPRRARRSPQGAAEMDDATQVCNCNGVSKGELTACVARASTRSVTGVMAATRAGKGCGSCKSLVTRIVEWAVEQGGGEVTEDESAGWYVPSIPMAKPELIEAIRERELRSVSAVFAALAPDGEHAPSKMALASLLKTVWAARVRGGEGRPLHQRPGARQHPARRHVLGRPADVRRGHHGRRAAPDRRHRRPLLHPDDQGDRRAADRPARGAQGGPPGGLGEPGHALGLRLRQIDAHGEDVRRDRLLPVRPGRLHAARDRHRGAVQGPGEPGEDEAGRGRLPPQLRRVDGQGRRDRGRVGDDRWEVYVGGAAGASIRKGDVLATVDGRDEAIRL